MSTKLTGKPSKVEKALPLELVNRLTNEGFLNFNTDSHPRILRITDVRNYNTSEELVHYMLNNVRKRNYPYHVPILIAFSEGDIKKRVKDSRIRLRRVDVEGQPYDLLTFIRKGTFY